MSILDNFRNNDFPKQIELLTIIQAEKMQEAIPDLFDLYQNPLKDTMVDHLVITSLHSLLSADENETVMRIRRGNTREKALCITIAGINHFASAAPVLHSMLKDSEFKELYTESFFALGEIKSTESLGLFRDHLTDSNEMLASLSIQMVGQYRDEASINTLLSLIDNVEDGQNYEVCSLQTGVAIEALAVIKTDQSLLGLVSRIHHRNATVRRIIHDELVKIGPATVPFITTVFDHEDTDSKILAANILGLIGNKLGGEVMVRALDSGRADHPNVRYAIYEAFGRIRFLKGLTCLVDALTDDDDLILMAVLTALENQVSAGVITRVRELIGIDGTQADKIIRTLVAVKAVNLFKNLYSDEKTAQVIMAEILSAGDPEVIAAFKTVLIGMEGLRAKADLAKLAAINIPLVGRDVLAIDDSKAMLSFYRSLAADLGLKIVTAGNGKEALNLIEMGQPFDLIITDMNMPVMDGLELTRKIRQKTSHSKIPIIMVTTESEQSQQDMARSAGVDAFITKPFTAEILKEKVNSFLNA